MPRRAWSLSANIGAPDAPPSRWHVYRNVGALVTVLLTEHSDRDICAGRPSAWWTTNTASPGIGARTVTGDISAAPPSSKDKCSNAYPLSSSSLISSGGKETSRLLGGFFLIIINVVRYKMSRRYFLNAKPCGYNCFGRNHKCSAYKLCALVISQVQAACLRCKASVTTGSAK